MDHPLKSCTLGQIDSFAQAKKVLPQVYAGHQQTFYCGCPYTGKQVDFTVVLSK